MTTRGWADNRMSCVPGYGTYRRDTVRNMDVYVPSFVLLTSTGSDGPGVNGASPGRTIRSTYVVRTSNYVAAGGTIAIYPDGSGTSYCMDAGDVRAQGSAAAINRCEPDSRKAAQSWIYNPDRSIQLASSVQDAGATDQPQGNGLCLDSAAPHAAGNPIVLGWCAPTTRVDGVQRNTGAPWNQQWNSDDLAHLRGSQQDLSDWDNFCIATTTPRVSGQALTLQPCAGQNDGVDQPWQPDPRVGAGGATAPDPTPAGFLARPHQLVNFEQFGRCLDVLTENVNAPYMLTYSCKQNPNPARVTWNQLYALRSAGTASAPGRPDKGQWVTYAGGITDAAHAYCLRSTRTVGQYVTVVQCPPSPSAQDPATTWTTYLTTDDTGNELPYTVKYTIVDSAGLCLGLAPNTDLHVNTYSKPVSAVCDGSASQKWNALPNLQAPALQNTIEVPYTP